MADLGMSPKPKFFAVLVLEAVDLVPESPVQQGVKDQMEAFVRVTLNGSELLNKKSTAIKKGNTSWNELFEFKIEHQENDWVAVEIRERGYHLLASDWLGEVQLWVRDFMDGKSVDTWYALGKGLWKNHKREPRGFVHLRVQVMDNKFAEPFGDLLDQAPVSFKEWKEKGSAEKGKKLNLDRTISHLEEENPEKVFGKFELKNPMIQFAEEDLHKHKDKILAESKPSPDQVEYMRKTKKVNCLHKGNFEKVTGKIYMIFVDGSQAASQAFEDALKVIDKQKDHIFIVTIRERPISEDVKKDEAKVLLGFKLWMIASEIIKPFAERLQKDEFNYTSVIPQADDAKELAVALAKRYNVDTIYLGKHKGDETKHHKHSVFGAGLPGIPGLQKGFAKYVEEHAKCSVVTTK